MKHKLFVIFIIILTTACTFLQKPDEVPPVEELVSTDTVVPTEAVPEIPANTPATTNEPSPTDEPEIVFEPYLTDFSETSDNWEVILSEGTNSALNEDGQLILEASGISSSVVSSPISVANASEITIEVDVSFANTETEGEGGSAGIVCGITSENDFYGFEIDKEGIVSISFTNNRHTFTSLLYLRLREPDEQQNYHLKAICSSTGLD